MKKFKDLQAGDTVFIGFEKKTITKIRPDDESGCITIYISKDEFYLVPGHLSTDYDYSKYEYVFTCKEAVIEHYESELRELEIAHENRMARYEQWLKKAKQLED